ncbi:MAG: lytic murein transglycosylase, partial [Porticoccaceae bacterium]|nr:lytic murein transglycosylase [Porticoccaceae bacterium]
GFADIWNNTTDAIGSVANYFAEHGWKDGDPVATRIKLKPDYSPELITKGLKPDRTILEFSEHGYFPVDFASPDAMASAIKLDGQNGVEFWFGLHNFYVITRYNRSNMYAMAVYQVSQAIRERMEPHFAEK